MSFNPSINLNKLFPCGDPFRTPSSETDVNPFKTPVATTQVTTNYVPAVVIPRPQPRKFTFSKHHIHMSKIRPMSDNNLITECFFESLQDSKDQKNN